MNDHLDLLVPEWQGYGESRSVSYGALAIRDLLSPALDFTIADVPMEENLEIENDVLGYRSNVRVVESVRNCIESKNPKTIFLVGGTCASEIAPVSFLNRRYQGDFTVLWFDAHGDLNTPDSSPSKHFHGMPLRVLLGDAPKEIRSLVCQQSHCSQLILAGSRDLDSSESEYIERNQITRLSPSALESADALVAAIRKSRASNLYVHIDLDVLEPNDFPHLLIPTPGGMSFEDLLAGLRRIRAEFSIVGSSIVEYVPIGGGDPQRLKRLVDLIRPRRYW